MGGFRRLLTRAIVGALLLVALTAGTASAHSRLGTPQLLTPVDPGYPQLQLVIPVDPGYPQ